MAIIDCYVHFDFRLKDIRMIPISTFSYNLMVNTVIMITLRTLTEKLTEFIR